MKENLTCASCSKVWKRKKSRGRKPTFCPSCSSGIATPVAKKAPSRKVSKSGRKQTAQPVIPEPSPDPQPPSSPGEPVSKDFLSKVYNVLFPKPANSKEIKESTRNGSRWKCPNCNYVVELNVTVVQPPTHKCTSGSLSYREFVQID